MHHARAPRLDSLLYVDDEPSNLKVFRLHFEKLFTVHTASSGTEALALLERERIGLILTDERMPGMRGLELLEQVVERWPDTVRVLVSASADADRLLRAMHRGHAHEYILKPWNADELRACLERGLAMVTRRRELARRVERADALAQDARERPPSEQMVGACGGLAAVVHAARRAAQSDVTVLILGETGTGKEVLARFIHEHSARAQGPFVRVNCAALAEGLLESELFGHEQGAFSGAVRARQGRFELAHGGTLFLDEVGDMSPKLQVSLLRVLQEGEFERVGGNRTLRVDVRVIAATHRDLPRRVREERFREDLFYRLNVLPLRVPPLREREEDLEPLLQHFIARHGPPCARPRLAPEVVPALSQYLWPGNVRELENLVRRALVLSQGDELTLEDFHLQRAPGGVREQAQQSEQEELRRLLLTHGGNFASAARTLGIPRTTLVSRARKHGLL